MQEVSNKKNIKQKDVPLFEDGFPWWIVIIIILVFLFSLLNVWLCQTYGFGCNDLGSPNMTGFPCC